MKPFNVYRICLPPCLGIALLFSFCLRAEPTVIDLYEAVRTSDIKSIERALSGGTKPNSGVEVPGGQVFSLLGLSIFDREEDIALYLVSQGGRVELTQVTVHGIANEGMDRLLKAVLEQNPELLIQNNNILTAPAVMGHYDVCVFLLDFAEKIGFEWGDELGHALGGAIGFGYEDIARLLIERGRSSVYGGAIVSGAQSGSGGITRTLIQNGADPDLVLPQIPGLRFRTALEFAMERYQTEKENGIVESSFVIFELINASSLDSTPEQQKAARDPGIEVNSRKTVSQKVIRAAEIGYLDLVEPLIESVEHSEALTFVPEAIVAALKNDHDDIARTLIDTFDISNTNDQLLILSEAVKSSSPGLVRSILRKGYVADDPDSQYAVVNSWKEQIGQRSGPVGAYILSEIINAGLDVCHLDPASLSTEIEWSMLINTATNCSFQAVKD